jgi:uncharacterized protein (DUF2236 family)
MGLSQEVGVTFGPGSLIYESYGNRLGYLCAGATGLMQLMYPPLGRGVEQHSEFYDEPLERLLRSVPQIMGTIFDGDRAGAQAIQIREFHRDIKGTMPSGERYHALDPDTFFWAHATFIDVALRVDDLYRRHPMNLRQREAYYAECVEWWRMYGLSMRVVPKTYGDFQEYWDHHVDQVLEVTPAAQGLIDFMNRPWAMKQPWLPQPVWVPMTRLGGIPARDVSVGALPPRLRELCGFSWTPANEAAFTAFRTAVSVAAPLIPDSIALVPRVRAAYARQGRAGIDVALARADAGLPTMPKLEQTG